MDTSGTLLEALGMEFVSVERDRVVATMPVDERTRQPYGYLHGGATAALLETVASVGAVQNVDTAREIPLGVEICVQHRRSVREGLVTGTAEPLEMAPDRQLWSVVARDDQDRVISEGTCAIRVVARRD